DGAFERDERRAVEPCYSATRLAGGGIPSDYAVLHHHRTGCHEQHDAAAAGGGRVARDRGVLDGDAGTAAAGTFEIESAGATNGGLVHRDRAVRQEQVMLDVKSTSDISRVAGDGAAIKNRLESSNSCHENRAGGIGCGIAREGAIG